MPSILNAYLAALWSLLADLWLFMGIGFLTAGLVQEFVPRRAMLRYLGRNSLATLLRATLAGTVASVCSCGAIPIAVSIRQAGATRAAALTFLLAAPWAGFVQLIIFYRFLGWAGTAVIFAGSLLVAFSSGVVLARLESRGLLEGPSPDVDAAVGCEDDCSAVPQQANVSRPFVSRLSASLSAAWQAFLELWKFLGIGLLLAATLKAFVPLSWVSSYLGGQGAWNPVIVALPVAAAVELCSEGFSIFAGQLHEMGATLAVVFVIVMVGVATDFTELSVIWGKFGKRSMLAYLLVATTLSVIFALLLDSLSGRQASLPVNLLP